MLNLRTIVILRVLPKDLATNLSRPGPSRSTAQDDNVGSADTAFRRAGFTLLELILVMAVICMALAIAAPSLSNWNHGSHQRDAVDQILALTRYARTQAVTNATTYRLNIDKSAGRYWLTMQDGQEFVALGNDMGQVFNVPDGARLELSQDQGPAIDLVEFYPSGRTQAARIRLTSSIGEITTIECAMPAEGFQVATAQVSTR